ncbi:hypothetical protein [Streptomyces celluloflavus]|uniref:hypothetical protein n=1 Tax=Streptomyces celluloflavus TaxID=58344 RepID=UPI003683EF57
MPLTSAAEFDTLIDAIAENHVARMKAISNGLKAPAGLLLPSHIERTTLSDGVPEEVRDVLDSSAKDPNQMQVEVDKDNVAPAAQAYANDEMPKSDFDDLMDKQTDDNINEFSNSQYDTRDKLKALGHQHQDWQDVILNAFKEVGDYLLGSVWQPVANFFEDLIKQIQEFWNQVVDWFTGVWNGITDWWNSTFGG